MASTEFINSIINKLNRLSLKEGLELMASNFSNATVFSTSFSYEDQIISHEILQHQIPIKIFTLDTGRLFPETYSVWNRTNEKYNTQIVPYYPNADSLQNFVKEHGPNSFYNSVEHRKQCCFIRKVLPLKQALAGNKVWVTGLRAEHSPNRNTVQPFEWDEGNAIFKYNPLLHWSTAQIESYIHQHQIPYNPLHTNGFVSIGCAPCTRAIKEGEDFRAGRWWWEDRSKKECGLHTNSPAKV